MKPKTPPNETLGITDTDTPNPWRFEGDTNDRMGPITDLATWKSQLTKLETKGHRASRIFQIGRSLLTFHTKLSPSHFERLAKVLVDIVNDPLNKPRPKLRAIEVALNTTHQCIILATELSRRQRPDLVQHLEDCMLAFAAGFGAKNLAMFAEKLVDLATQGPMHERADQRITAVETVMKLTVRAIDTFTRLQQIAENEQEEMLASDPKRLKAQEEFRKMVECQENRLSPEVITAIVTTTSEPTS